MTLYLEEEGEVKLPFDAKTQAEKVVEGTLTFLQCPYEAQVNLLLTMNRQIQELNEKFRQMDQPTDVLSFPMLTFPAPGDFDALAEDPDGFDPDTGELVLGDMVVSKEKVMDQAAAYGHTPLREFSFLIVHSVLHLTGYDHIQEADRLLMEKRQKEILAYLQIPR